ncbi:MULTISPECIES: archaetidylserine decarboxylase [Methanothermobacter]|uniref:Putative archaetidylserine decarboxylase proenzyme n=1 Tax=Methanothermobacter marburgensis (strain ATCC BAA-927 / DSM 2133 / JCM 14651 / NBRC 100331 / OCM 82 / Marburg) TaxID=79929 RepID=D9PXP7_METTM|nr:MULTISPECIES: archaetidylserine decarboxylase [Methanothermobacter]ADL58995.1 predicted phosphatidylserine decarboxylase [Methanothermobacter marburgensis str. Marburg]QEF94824.1 phosphatidylserine decarboxylase family protein [Methanothermobacter sp. KEPCO-1]QHN07958.1 phosphatidylserine decarboxylase family protein [Methanothermobacter sp. THM-2]WBF09531.1 phosphatidylserine decarboxylase family protein [Methanothermobacter marburgensis]
MFVKGVAKRASFLISVATIPFLLGYHAVSILMFSLIAFMMQFFRDPERNIPSEDNIIVAPADGRRLSGKIDRIKRVGSDYPLIDRIFPNGGEAILISTFMSPFDVHVNRAPVSGRVIYTEHTDGKFRVARSRVLTENERNLIVIETEHGNVGVVQIAGFIARRIVQYVNEGDYVERGSRIGMIRFGSRVDLILPENCEVLVKTGSRSVAGETVVARFVKPKSDRKN